MDVQANLSTSNAQTSPAAAVDPAQLLARLHSRALVQFDGQASLASAAVGVLVQQGHAAAIGHVMRRDEAATPAWHPTEAADLFSAVPGGERDWGRWMRRMQRDVARQGVAGALQTWLPTLMDGVVGAGFAGLLRTAQAVRWAQRVPGGAGADEVARGLALWAVTHQSLPGEVAADALHPSTLESMDVLETLAFVPADLRTTGTWQDHLSQLHTHAPWETSVARMWFEPRSLQSACTVLADFAAEQVLLNFATADAYARVLAAVSALRTLAEVVDERLLMHHLPDFFKAVAAVHAVCGRETALAESALVRRDAEETPRQAEQWQERAATLADPAVVLVVDAAQREARVGGHPVLLEAAALMVRRSERLQK